MKHKWLILIAIVIATPILAILALLVLQKPYVRLKVDNRVVAVVRQPFVQPILGEGFADIYAGKEKIFSLREDFWDDPDFIYPFADGKRFLCDYCGDTAQLDFVVDFGAINTNDTSSPKWPLDEQLRASKATNIVCDTKGTVRLPNYEEVQEVLAYVTSINPNGIKAGYLGIYNMGIKKCLLIDLATNREGLDP